MNWPKPAEADFGERNADAVGAVAVLDAADAFALENGDDGEHGGEDEGDERHRKEGGHKRTPGVGNKSHRLLL